MVRDGRERAALRRLARHASLGLAMLQLAAAAGAQSPAGEPPPHEVFRDRARFMAVGADLPTEIRLEALKPELVATLAATFTKDSCGGWVYAADERDPNRPGAPVIALPPAGFGIFKSADKLWPVVGPVPMLASGRPRAVRVRGTGFVLGPLYEVQDYADVQRVVPHDSNSLGVISLLMEAEGGRIVTDRVACTHGGGYCRRYQGRYGGKWLGQGSGPPQTTVAIKPAILIVEDRCPWTRRALIERYASRLAWQERFYRAINP